MLLALTLASVARRARAEAPPVRAAGEDLSAEDEAMLEVIDLLWELPLLEEWDPEEDAPHPIVEAPPPASKPETAKPAPEKATPP